jgi:hypothetical protein
MHQERPSAHRGPDGPVTPQAVTPARRLLCAKRGGLSEAAVWATKRQRTRDVPTGTSSDASDAGWTVAVHFPELPQLVWSKVLFACESDGIAEGDDLRVKR